MGFNSASEPYDLGEVPRDNFGDYDSWKSTESENLERLEFDSWEGLEAFCRDRQERARARNTEHGNARLTSTR